MKASCFWVITALLVFPRLALADAYTDAVLAAESQRNTFQAPGVFAGLSTIGPGDLHTLVVDNGSGGNKTIQALQVTTLSSFVTPYTSATPLQRFINADGPSDHFRGNIWVTLYGAARSFYETKGLPVTDNETVMHYLQEAVGIPHLPNYQAITFWVEPQYLVRPSFNPDITTNASPLWDSGNNTYTFTNISAGVDADFHALAPVTLSGNIWQRPFDRYDGPVNYPAWLDQWSTVSYDLGADRAFPYTGLGWTWDWNPDPSLNGFALSEFIVSGGAEYYFDSLKQPINLVPEPSTTAIVIGAGTLLFFALHRIQKRKPVGFVPTG